MNTGQMLLVLGALVMLSMMTMGVNKMIINKTETMLEEVISTTVEAE
ncbi:MAG: hypothetical protein HY707_00755 [Ignavibacteriae bacterium]|nr:hypothetical protein [Ignavibacteriota bacterium]